MDSDDNSYIKPYAARYVCVMMDQGVIQHAALMILFAFILYPICYSFKILKSRKLYCIMTVLNTLILIFLCIDASFVMKPRYLDFVKRTSCESSSSDMNDINSDTTSKTKIRTKSTFHSQLVSVILFFQLIQILGLFGEYVKDRKMKLKNGNFLSCIVENNKLASFLFLCIEKTNTIINWMGYFLFTCLLPLSMYSGITTISHGTMIAKQLDFLEHGWNYGHLIPNLPYYFLGLYYLWNRKYSKNNIYFFHQSYFWEAILIFLFSLIEMIGEIIYYIGSNKELENINHKSQYANDFILFNTFGFRLTLSEWHDGTWHHETMAINYFVCCIVSLTMYFILTKFWIWKDKNNNNHNHNNNNNNHNVLIWINIHNLLIGCSIMVYGYGLTLHHPVSSHREAIEGIHGLSGNFAMYCGILKIIMAFPCTIKILKMKNQFNNEYDIIALIEEFLFYILSLLAFCHFFVFMAANPTTTCM